MLEGSIDVTVGDDHHRLKAGDCLAMVLDRPVSYHNPTRVNARYAVVIATLPLSAQLLDMRCQQKPQHTATAFTAW